MRTCCLANWDTLRGKVDYVLSPYNCEGDPSGNNIRNAKRLAIPSAWADRTGTVYCGDGYMMNPGTTWRSRAGQSCRLAHIHCP
jgi:hypothetical protein